MTRPVDAAAKEGVPSPRRLPKVSGEALALCGALAFYFVIGATRLNATGLWADEAWSLAAVNHLGMSLRDTDGTMGAYYVLLWLWGKVSTSTPWLRALSTVFGVGTIVLTRAIARRIGGSTLAIWAPLFLVTSPMFLWTSTEARGYAMETFLTAGLWYIVIRLSERGAATGTRIAHVRWSALFCFVVVLGPLTHGFFALQLLALGFWIVGNNSRRLFVATAPGFLGGIIATMWLWSSDLKHAGTITLGTPVAILRELWHWFISSMSGVAAVVVLVLIVATLLRRFDLRSGRRRALSIGSIRSIPAIWAVLPTVALLGVRAYRNTWAAYYQAPVTPGLALLFGLGAIALSDVVRDKVKGTARGAGVAPVVLVLILAISVIALPKTKNEGWRAAATLVAEKTEPGDVVIFTGGSIGSPMQSRAPFEAAWREIHHRVTPRSIAPQRSLGSVQRVDIFPTSHEIIRKALRHHRVWVVDYKGVLSSEHIVDAPAFTSHFHEALSEEFNGPITVALYESGG